MSESCNKSSVNVCVFMSINCDPFIFFMGFRMLVWTVGLDYPRDWGLGLSGLASDLVIYIEHTDRIVP